MLKFECMGKIASLRYFKDLSIGEYFTWYNSTDLCIKVSDMCYYDINTNALLTIYNTTSTEDNIMIEMDIWESHYNENSEIRKVTFEDCTIKWRYEK